MFMANLPGTNSFLLAIEKYETDGKIEGCGLLSTQVILLCKYPFKTSDDTFGKDELSIRMS